MRGHANGSSERRVCEHSMRIGSLTAQERKRHRVHLKMSVMASPLPARETWREEELAKVSRCGFRQPEGAPVARPRQKAENIDELLEDLKQTSRGRSRVSEVGTQLL